MTHKIPSIKTVASRAGVSMATVSNVLNARRGVAPHLAERVHAAVEELGYIADVAASRLRSRRSTVAGVLVPDISNEFFGEFVSVLETAARRDGYDLLIVSSGGDPAQEAARMRALVTWRPAGVIVVPCDDALAARKLATANGVHMVVADRIPADATFDVVSVDNGAIALRATQHLMDRGHRDILTIASSLTISNMRERVEGARAAASGNLSLEVLECGLNLHQSHDTIHARLAQRPLPTAIFALDNIVTLGALSALAEHGLAVPRDVALVGFDDAEWMRVVTPPLTTVRQPVEDLAQASWARLMARIGGDVTPPQLVRLQCSLEIRASSGQNRGVPGIAAA